MRVTVTYFPQFSECRDGTYGENCEHTCTCDHGVCDKLTGECMCDSGWAGPNCDIGKYSYSIKFGFLDCLLFLLAHPGARWRPPSNRTQFFRFRIHFHKKSIRFGGRRPHPHPQWEILDPTLVRRCIHTLCMWKCGQIGVYGSCQQ